MAWTKEIVTIFITDLGGKLVIVVAIMWNVQNLKPKFLPNFGSALSSTLAQPLEMEAAMPL
jgi:hypothetical protein